MNISELKMLQALPLDLKVAKTKLRIRDAINHFGYEELYLSFSGGKDSTVLHYLVKEVEMELYKEIRIPRVFVNTGLEYPELVKFVKSFDKDLIEETLIELRPDMTFKEVLTKYGYPVVSKSQAFAIRKLTTQNLTLKYRNKLLHGDEKGTAGKLSNKHHYLLDADFKISEQCCDVMKKKPFRKFEKATWRNPIVGVMAAESVNRQIRYLKDGGCNAFNNKKPQSRPIGFWTEQDILKYIFDNRIEIAKPYGSVYNIDDSKYGTTGESRTGCVFCIFGAHLEKGKNRFERMKESHPQLYDYCIRGGKYENGKWIPDKGLGMAKVLTDLKVKY